MNHQSAIRITDRLLFTTHITSIHHTNTKRQSFVPEFRLVLFMFLVALYATAFEGFFLSLSTIFSSIVRQGKALKSTKTRKPKKHQKLLAVFRPAKNRPKSVLYSPISISISLFLSSLEGVILSGSKNCKSAKLNRQKSGVAYTLANPFHYISYIGVVLVCASHSAAAFYDADAACGC